MTKKIFSLIGLLFFSYVFLSAQDSQYSMPYSALLNLNPAFAGSAGCPRVQGEHRAQWPSLYDNYITSYLSYDQYVNAISGGIGVSYERENESRGAVKTSSINGIYSAHIPVFKNKFVICPAIEATYTQKALDWTKLAFGSRSDSLEKIASPDLSAGVVGYGKRFYGGLSVFHLTEPKEYFPSGRTSHLPQKFTGDAGINIGRDSAKSFSVSPSILYSAQQDLRSLTMNCAVKYDKFIIGLGYRNSGDILLSAGFKSRSIRIGYCYDITTSKLGIVTGDSHEFSLSCIFNSRKRHQDFLRFSSSAF